jgi:hypothetical protein
MDAPAPTTAKLMAIITTIQAQNVALQNATPAAAAAPPAGAAAVVFADMPQTLGANDLIDYSTKRGSTIVEKGCIPLDDKALTNGFAMTPNQRCRQSIPPSCHYDGLEPGCHANYLVCQQRQLPGRHHQKLWAN